MAEVVGFIAAVLLVTAAVLIVGEIIIRKKSLSELKQQLEELRAAFEELEQQREISTLPDSLFADNIVPFAKNKIIREWWISGGEKKAEEE